MLLMTKLMKRDNECCFPLFFLVNRSVDQAIVVPSLKINDLKKKEALSRSETNLYCLPNMKNHITRQHEYYFCVFELVCLCSSLLTF